MAAGFLRESRCLICGGAQCSITERLLEALPPSIDSLHLEECRLLRSVGSIARLQHLSALSLEDSVKTVSELLGICQRCSLISLNISGCAVDDDGVSHISASLPRLLELEVCSTPISDSGLRAIARHCPRLLHLGILNCDSISNEAVRDIRQTLPACIVSFLDS